MKTKTLVGILMLFLFTYTFISCDKEDEAGRKITDYKEYVLTVASEMKPGVMWSEGNNFLKEVYVVKKENAEDWEAMGYIDGFEFERGYEYKIKISETSFNMSHPDTSLHRTESETEDAEFPSSTRSENKYPRIRYPGLEW